VTRARTSGSAALAAILLAVLALAGCAGPPPPPGQTQKSTAPAPASAPLARTHGATVVGDARDGAVQTARAFALAARGWTATSLRAQWRRQVTLSTGQLHRTLRGAPPLRADLQRLRADGAAATATILEVATIEAGPARVRLLIRLREQTTAAGQTTEQTTDNQVDVVRRGAGWRVATFTLAP
jgi:hypothetical protein